MAARSTFGGSKSATHLAAGCVMDGDEITLNFVSPDAHFFGVRTALFRNL
jgi:hypothetical protein